KRIWIATSVDSAVDDDDDGESACLLPIELILIISWFLSSLSADILAMAGRTSRKLENCSIFCMFCSISKRMGVKVSSSRCTETTTTSVLGTYCTVDNLRVLV
ncbi:hypothetical protein ACHAXS_012639, partial [Conticribra weissflogii]